MAANRTTVKTKYRGYLCQDRNRRVVEVVFITEQAHDLVAHPDMVDALDENNPWSARGDDTHAVEQARTRLLAGSIAAHMLGGDKELALALAPLFALRLSLQMGGTWEVSAAKLSEMLVEALHGLTVHTIARLRARAAGGEDVRAEVEKFKTSQMEAYFRLSEFTSPLASTAYVHYVERDDDADDGEVF